VFDEWWGIKGNKEGAKALPYDLREKLTTRLKFASIISVDFSHGLNTHARGKCNPI
jgi:hypothetical protein